MSRAKKVPVCESKRIVSRRTNSFSFDAKEDLGTILHMLYQGLGRGHLSDFIRDAVQEKWEKENVRLTLEIKRTVEARIKQLNALVHPQLLLKGSGHSSEGE